MLMFPAFMHCDMQVLCADTADFSSRRMSAAQAFAWNETAINKQECIGYYLDIGQLGRGRSGRLGSESAAGLDN